MGKPVCAVVGIGPGNGASFARRFGSAGYAVALLSRSTEYASALATELETAKAFACDVSEQAAMQKAFSAVRDQLGEVEVLLYNAGSGVWGDIEKITAQDFEKSWRVNALGAFLAAKEVIPAMKEKGRGTILVVGATASWRGKPFTTAFAPAKAAQRSLVQALARHLWPSGIHVALLIIDGQIGRLTAEQRQKPATLDPDDIAETALFLTRQPRSAWSFEVDLRPFGESW